MARPVGVTIIGILMAIAGVVMIIAGISAIALAPIIPMATESEELAMGISSTMFGGIAIASGAILLSLGIVSLVVAYGLFKGLSWAWTAAVVLSIIGIVMSVVSIVTGNFGSIVSLIINGVILYYLYRPHVKAYFGKAVSAPASDAAAA
ncbi:MAG TPA: hypothetical protein VF172_01600 [Nitrososphaera sp.]|jgi:hypothetical protein